MKMHLAWIRVTAAAAATIASFGGQSAAGQSQYGPYASVPQYSTPYAAPQYAAPQTQPYSPTQPYVPAHTAPPRYATTVSPYGVQPMQQAQQAPAAAVQPTQQQAYPTTSAPTYYSAARAPYSPAPKQATAPVADRYATPAPAAQVTYQAPQYQAPQYQPPGTRPAYPLVAQNTNGNVAPGPEPAAEMLPTPAPAMNDPAAQGYNLSGSAPAGSYPAADCNCNAGTFDDQGYGLDGYMDDCDGGGSLWFGGVYALYMTRSQPSYQPYTAGVDSVAVGTPYYPQPGDIENESDCSYLVPDWREGIEVRLGCAFAVGDGCDYGDCGTGCGPSACGCNDPCGCQPCCQPCCQQMYAWEVAWWGIDRDVQDQFVDGPLTANFRYYGMINYAGLEYDPGSGAQGVNDFYNYQIPITGPGAETVLSQRVRTNFTAQNLELNMLRLPLYMGGCGCDPCASPFTITGLCGVRYFGFGDDFEFATEWDDGSAIPGWGNGTNELFHDINMENDLVGFQLGANMNYCCATRWNFFWDTNFGIYNNHVSQYQRMYNPLVGNATFAQDGREFSVMSTKNDVAFLGEMRVGGGFLITEHWRGILAYRAIAISGVALAPDQIRPEYNSWTDTARINADGSIIIHGAQAGIECSF